MRSLAGASRARGSILHTVGWSSMQPARIIDQLHFAGILGPPDGSKPREVLIGFDQMDEYCGER